MALWDKLKQELDRAGKAAQGALDEGKIRLDAMRVRQNADKAAQALGYAVFRSRQSGSELDAETYARLSGTLAEHEAEAKRLESQLEDVKRSRGAEGAGAAGGPAGGGATGGTTGSAAGAGSGTAGGASTSGSGSTTT